VRKSSTPSEIAGVAHHRVFGRVPGQLFVLGPAATKYTSPLRDGKAKFWEAGLSPFGIRAIEELPIFVSDCVPMLAYRFGRRRHPLAADACCSIAGTSAKLFEAVERYPVVLACHTAWIHDAETSARRSARPTSPTPH
jgi:hypothetical protein